MAIWKNVDGFYRYKVKGKTIYSVVPIITRQKESVESEVRIVVNFTGGWAMADRSWGGF